MIFSSVIQFGDTRRSAEKALASGYTRAELG